MDRRPDRQLLLFAVVLLGASGLAAGRLPGTERLEAAVGGALTPVTRSLSALSDQVSAAISGAHTVQALRATNAELQAQNDRLEAEKQKYDDLTRELANLRRQLDFRGKRVDLDLSGASLIGRPAGEDPGNLRHIVRLDIGTEEGIRRRMPVAADRGLVGQVLAVSPAWSDVLLITDPESRVEGRVQRSGATGIVFGTPTGELVMRYLPQDSPDGPPVVEVDDLVFTSGLSSRFPRLLLIGQVVAVHQLDVETHQEALIRPSVDFNALEHVLVVRDWRPPDAAAADGPGD
jgi:rod shape-determining protein MreC